MAKVKMLNYSVGRRISDQDFGSMDFHVGETVELDSGDSHIEEYKRLVSRVNKKAGIIADKIQESINEKLARKKGRS